MGEWREGIPILVMSLGMVPKITCLRIFVLSDPGLPGNIGRGFLVQRFSLLFS